MEKNNKAEIWARAVRMVLLDHAIHPEKPYQGEIYLPETLKLIENRQGFLEKHNISVEELTRAQRIVRDEVSREEAFTKQFPNGLTLPLLYHRMMKLYGDEKPHPYKPGQLVAIVACLKCICPLFGYVKRFDEKTLTIEVDLLNTETLVQQSGEYVSPAGDKASLSWEGQIATFNGKDVTMCVVPHDTGKWYPYDPDDTLTFSEPSMADLDLIWVDKFFRSSVSFMCGTRNKDEGVHFPVYEID